MISDLNERSKLIFKYIVDSYMETGLPVGSRTLSGYTDINFSAATIRNIMSELERMELLYAPHVSSGRLPTQKGLRFYIDGLMEINALSHEEQERIDEICASGGRTTQEILERTGHLLTGLSNCASLVVAPKTNKPLEQIQFIKLDERKILVILVMHKDTVENRILELDFDLPQPALDQAANYLNHLLKDTPIEEAQICLEREIKKNKTQLDKITQNLVLRGLALPVSARQERLLIIRGQSRLLQDVKALEELEHAKELLALLEEKETSVQLLNSLENAQGVQIYIGTENDIFSHSGWSVMLSPYKKAGNIVGAIGVIGPQRINYGKIIPILDYTAKVMDNLLNG